MTCFVLEAGDLPPLVLSHFSVVTSLGDGQDTVAEALASGRSGLSRCAFADVTIPTWVGEVSGLDDAPLSPRAERPYEREFDQRRNTWLAVLVVAMGVASALAYLGLWAVTDMEARDLVIEHVTRDGSE